MVLTGDARRASSKQATLAVGQGQGEQGVGTGAGRGEQGAGTGAGRGGAEPHSEDEGVADHSRAGEEELGHAAGQGEQGEYGEAELRRCPWKLNLEIHRTTPFPSISSSIDLTYI